MSQQLATGTRIMVSVILDNSADEMTPDEIVADYPPLTTTDIRAAMMLRKSWRQRLCCCTGKGR
ncbi:MAG: DUF433 domain-containing protein [Elainellaceae cyanobacterium]